MGFYMKIWWRNSLDCSRFFSLYIYKKTFFRARPRFRFLGTKKAVHLPVHGCRIRAPERSHPQSPVRWARKRRTDSNRLALVAAVVSVRISRRPAARTQSTTSPWRSCRRRRVTTTGPIIVADDIIRHWWSARRRDWRFGTLGNTCRAYDESRDLIYDRGRSDLSRSIDHDSRWNTRVSHRIRALYFREDAGSGKTNAMRADGSSRVAGWRAAPRVSLVVVVVVLVSEPVMPGLVLSSYPATQRRGKPQVIAAVYSCHARQVGRTRWEFLRAPSAVRY